MSDGLTSAGHSGDQISSSYSKTVSSFLNSSSPLERLAYLNSQRNMLQHLQQYLDSRFSVFWYVNLCDVEPGKPRVLKNQVISSGKTLRVLGCITNHSLDRANAAR